MEKNEKKITTTAEFINEVQNVLNSEKPQEVKKTKSERKKTKLLKRRTKRMKKFLKR